MILLHQTNFMKYPLPKKTIIIPLFLTSLIWIIFLIENNNLGLRDCYGVVPRTFYGLKGILFSPLFHSGWSHIISNTFPLLFLSFLTLLMYERLGYYVIGFGWILSGILLWLIGNPTFLDDSLGCHIGASGIIYMLASFLLLSGIIRKERGLMAISGIVILLYGGMFWGVIPEEFLPSSGTGKNSISWEGHLSGLAVGIFFAFLFRNVGPQKQKPYWENENYYDPREEELWQRYLDITHPKIDQETVQEISLKEGEYQLNDEKDESIINKNNKA